MTPKRLVRTGPHDLRAIVRGRRGKRTVAVRFDTRNCQALFSATRRKVKRGQALRLRVDASTSLRTVSFALPSSLVRGRAADRPLLAAGSAPLTLPLTLPATDGPASASATPSVRLERGALIFTGMPDRVAVVEVTLKSRSLSRKRFALKATVTRDGAASKVFAKRPRAPR